jgi:hypothetical protein
MTATKATAVNFEAMANDLIKLCIKNDGHLHINGEPVDGYTDIMVKLFDVGFTQLARWMFVRLNEISLDLSASCGLNRVLDAIEALHSDVPHYEKAIRFCADLNRISTARTEPKSDPVVKESMEKGIHAGMQMLDGTVLAVNVVEAVPIMIHGLYASLLSGTDMQTLRVQLAASAPMWPTSR